MLPAGKRDATPGEPAALERAVAGADELEHGPSPSTGRVVAGTAAVMLGPPVIAALAGNLALSTALGILSLFAGLVGFAIYSYVHEHWARRPPRRRLPRARARRRLRLRG